jgi:hypothetical protein
MHGNLFRITTFLYGKECVQSGWQVTFTVSGCYSREERVVNPK